jgi:hypothetical protein
MMIVFVDVDDDGDDNDGGDDDDDNDNNNNNNNNNKQRMWNIQARVIPVIIGATGTISKSFRKCVSSIPGKPRS